MSRWNGITSHIIVPLSIDGMSNEQVLESTQLLIRLHLFIVGFKVSICIAFKNTCLFVLIEEWESTEGWSYFSVLAVFSKCYISPVKYRQDNTEEITWVRAVNFIRHRVSC